MIYIKNSWTGGCVHVRCEYSSWQIVHYCEVSHVRERKIMMNVFIDRRRSPRSVNVCRNYIFIFLFRGDLTWLSFNLGEFEPTFLFRLSRVRWAERELLRVWNPIITDNWHSATARHYHSACKSLLFQSIPVAPKKKSTLMSEYVNSTVFFLTAAAAAV